jgi:osmoprotectant transport system substrate-binding protein
MFALGASTLALLLSACSTGGGGSTSASASGSQAAKPKVIVGSADFPESQIVGEIYAQALESKGFTVERKFNIGARALTNQALKAGQINLMPEYIGSMARELKAEATGDAKATYDALKVALDPIGLAALNYAPGADQNGFVVRKETADQFSLKTLSDVGKVANQLRWGLPSECSKNPSCGQALKDIYGIDITQVKLWKKLTACSGDMAAALTAGTPSIDIAEFCTTQPAIVQFNLVLLEDDKHSQSADNMVPVLRKDLLDAGGADLSDTLNAVSAKLTTEQLTKMGAAVGIDHKKIEDVAKQFLDDNGLM